VRIADERLEVIQAGPPPGRRRQPEHRKLVPLVAALIVGHDYRPLPGKVAARARPRQRGERRHRAIRLDLDELRRSGFVAASQHSTLGVKIESLKQAYLEN